MLNTSVTLRNGTNYSHFHDNMSQTARSRTAAPARHLKDDDENILNNRVPSIHITTHFCSGKVRLEQSQVGSQSIRTFAFRAGTQKQILACFRGTRAGSRAAGLRTVLLLQMLPLDTPLATLALPGRQLEFCRDDQIKSRGKSCRWRIQGLFGNRSPCMCCNVLQTWSVRSWTAIAPCSMRASQWKSRDPSSWSGRRCVCRLKCCSGP